MILSVFFCFLLFHRTFGIWDTVANLEIVKTLPAVRSIIDQLNQTVDDLNKKITSATFSVFLPLLTDEEFYAGHEGYKPKNKPNATTLHHRSKRSKKNYGSSNEVDLRKTGCLPDKVRNQGDCACCYAFVFEVAMYYLACKNKDTQPSGYSVEEMASCTSGCNGGHMHDVWEYIQKKKGVCSDLDYPYTAEPDTKCNPTGKKRYLNEYKLKYLGWPQNPFPKEEDIKGELDKGYPLFVPISVNPAVRHYKDGIITDEGCKSRKNKKGEDLVNHIVLCVGYGTDSKWGDYWLILNSWGSEWGDGGYMKIKRGINCIGVATETSRIEMEKK